MWRGVETLSAHKIYRMARATINLPHGVNTSAQVPCNLWRVASHQRADALQTASGRCVAGVRLAMLKSFKRKAANGQKRLGMHKP